MDAFLPAVRPDRLFYRGVRYGLLAAALIWAIVGTVLYYVV
jgi:hypothetical protein